VKDYPFKSNYFEQGGQRLHYLDEGQGPPVVMVHGNPTWSYYYRHLVGALSRHHRVIVPDHIGCGLSDKPSREEYPFTLARRIDDLTALIQHLKISEPIRLVVHDWGGMIGFGWAVNHPRQVESLVVLNTAAFGLPEGKKIPWQLRLVRETPFGRLLVQGFNLFAKGAVSSCVTKSVMDQETREAFLKPYDSWSHRLAVYRFVEDIPLTEAHPSYAKVREIQSKLPLLRQKSMLIAWGLKDFVFDADYLREWKTHFPEAQVLEFAESGHYILEDERALLCKKIPEFYGDPPGSGESPPPPPAEPRRAQGRST